MGVLHMPTAAGHHPLKSCPRHEAPPQIILKSVTFTMTTDSPSRAPPRERERERTAGIGWLRESGGRGGCAEWRTPGAGPEMRKRL